MTITPSWRGYQATGTFGVGLEKVVRPFTQAVSKLPDPPKEVQVIPLPGEDSEAFLSWGEEASFTIESDGHPIEDLNADNFGGVSIEEGSVGQGISVGGDTFSNASSAGGNPLGTLPSSQKKPQDNRPGVLSYQEIDRQVSTITVYNPKDKEQWVKVQRTLSIRFRNMQNGAILKLNLKNPPPPPKPKDEE